MTRCAVATLAMLLFVAASMAQKQPSSKGPKPVQKTSDSKDNLSDSFAKTALRALTAIQRDASTPDYGKGAKVLDNNAVDNADAQARNVNEKAVVALLRTFYFARLTNNMRRDRIERLRESEKIEGDPTLQTINQWENECVNVLDAMLTARVFQSTEACQLTKLSESMSAEIQVRVFAVTVGGDLKPARMATVLLFSGDAAAAIDLLTFPQYSYDSEQSRRHIEHLRALGVSPTMLLDELNRVQLETEGAQLDCRLALVNRVQLALKNVTDHPDITRAIRANEEGEFTVKVNRLPKDLTILVVGRAGANAAIWKEAVHLSADQKVLKISSPKISCFDPSNTIPF